MPRRHLIPLVFLSAVLAAFVSFVFAKRDRPQDDYPILRVAMSRSGQWFAAASKSGWIGIFDRSHPDTPQRFRLEFGDVRDLRFTADEEWLTIATPRQVWRHPAKILGSTEPVPQGQDAGEPQTAAQVPSGVDASEVTSNVVTASKDGETLFGNLAGSVEIHERSGKLRERYTFR